MLEKIGNAMIRETLSEDVQSKIHMSLKFVIQNQLPEYLCK